MSNRTAVLHDVADSLQLPEELLRLWQRQKAIRINPIADGWHLIIYKEPAATLITETLQQGQHGFMRERESAERERSGGRDATAHR